jgi:hypothetical protein
MMTRCIPACACQHNLDIKNSTAVDLSCKKLMADGAKLLARFLALPEVLGQTTFLNLRCSANPHQSILVALYMLLDPIKSRVYLNLSHHHNTVPGALSTCYNNASVVVPVMNTFDFRVYMRMLPNRACYTSLSPVSLLRKTPFQNPQGFCTPLRLQRRA